MLKVRRLGTDVRSFHVGPNVPTNRARRSLLLERKHEPS